MADRTKIAERHQTAAHQAAESLISAAERSGAPREMITSSVAGTLAAYIVATSAEMEAARVAYEAACDAGRKMLELAFNDGLLGVAKAGEVAGRG